MQTRVTFFRFGTLGVILWFLAATGGGLKAQAQATPEIPSAKSTVPEELSPAELLKSYLYAREQLHAAQLAIVKDRAEAEAAARAQAAALAEKLDLIRAAMEADRERHRTETERLNSERERQQAEAQRSARNVLWVATAIGVLGILSMVLTPLFQWRAIRRVAEAAATVPRLTAPPAQNGLMMPAEAGALGEHAVAHSNQRLVSVLDRLERRILELEQTTAVHPLPASPSANGEMRGESKSSRRAAAAPMEDPRISLLLGKGRALININKPKQAVVTFDELLAIEPNHSEALVKKGAALERMARDEEAIRCYDQAIKADGKMTLAYLYKGGVCNRLGRYDEAVECYEQALQTEDAGR